MCLMAGHNGLPVTQNQLKEMEENRERKERREEGSDRRRKRTVNKIMRREKILSLKFVPQPDDAKMATMKWRKVRQKFSLKQIH